MEHLVAEGVPCDFAAPDYGGEGPLALAAGLGDLRTMKVLMAASADIDFAEEECTTPLMAAVYARYREAVELLVSSGAHLNVVSAGGTALDVAKSKRDSELCRILRGAGALTKREVKA